ncbi:MAG TPA: 7-cyano-7-deazaguanine synthase QueC [Methanoculleus sp.]|nr:7-cyano-7-deazaguanine synthase QueC [Methanoculleus sp.]
MKAVCLLSGGMDSSTLAYVARDMGYVVYALHMAYGQRTENRERECARKISELLGAEEFLEISLAYFARIGGSSLVDRAMAIADHVEGETAMPSTYVPFRNANLLSIATSYAEARGADAIFIGVQASDYAGYPDCRPEFIDAFQRVIDLGTADSTRIRLITPFVRMNKADILRTGIDLGVPYEHTWSCYRSDGPACGRCDSCFYRLEAFRRVGARDPIAYAEER